MRPTVVGLIPPHHVSDTALGGKYTIATLRYHPPLAVEPSMPVLGNRCDYANATHCVTSAIKLSTGRVRVLCTLLSLLCSSRFMKTLCYVQPAGRTSGGPFRLADFLAGQVSVTAP